MKVLVCGGRDYHDHKAVQKILRMLKISYVVNGGATGADACASLWAIQNHIPYRAYLAEWSKHGKRAGPLRNQEMLDDNPDIEFAVAFPGGRGTFDMIKRLALENIFVFIAEPRKWDKKILEAIQAIPINAGDL